jgi:hypothetical protein
MALSKRVKSTLLAFILVAAAAVTIACSCGYVNGLPFPTTDVYIATPGNLGLTYIRLAVGLDNVDQSVQFYPSVTIDSMSAWQNNNLLGSPYGSYQACRCEKLFYTSGGKLYAMFTNISLNAPQTDTYFPTWDTPNQTATIDLGGRKAGSLPNTALVGGPLLVSLPSDAAVAVVDGVTQTLDHLIPLPGMTPGVIAVPTFATAYVLSGSTVVAFKDSTTDGILETASAPNAASMDAQDIGSGVVVAVTDEADDYVYVFDANLKPLGKADFNSIGYSPLLVTIPYGDGFAYVLSTNEANQAVLIPVNLNPSSNFALGKPLVVGNCPTDIKAGFHTMSLFVPDNCANTVSQIHFNQGNLGSPVTFNTGGGPTVVAIEDLDTNQVD